MRKAIDEEFEAIVKDIDRTEAEFQARIDDLKDQISITFATLRARINGEEIKKGPSNE